MKLPKATYPIYSLSFEPTLTFGKGIGGGRLTSWLSINACILHFARTVFNIPAMISFGTFLSFFQPSSISFDFFESVGGVCLLHTIAQDLLWISMICAKCTAKRRGASFGVVLCEFRDMNYVMELFGMSGMYRR